VSRITCWLVESSLIVYVIVIVIFILQTFFEELLKEQTIVIPGIFFDINPAHRRNLFHSPCHHFVRLSFGPPLEDLDKGKYPHSAFARKIYLDDVYAIPGLDAMGRVLRKVRKEGAKSIGHSYRKSISGPTVDTPKQI